MPSSQAHKDLDGVEIHRIFAFTYADETARLAASGFVAADVGKVAFQSDTKELFALVSYSPIEWLSLGGGSGAAVTPFTPDTTTLQLFDLTASAASNNVFYVATSGNTVTLPPPDTDHLDLRGIAFRVFAASDSVLSIVSAESLIITVGMSTATTVEFSTSGEKLGSHVLIECRLVSGGTWKWVVTNLGGTTATIS